MNNKRGGYNPPFKYSSALLSSFMRASFTHYYCNKTVDMSHFEFPLVHSCTAPTPPWLLHAVK